MIKRLIPDEYKPLLEYISPAAFKVIDWKHALKQFVASSKNAMGEAFARKVLEANKTLLAPKLQTLWQKKSDHSEAPDKRLLAETILDTYFGQLYSHVGCFLDLRLSNFSCQSSGVVWHPSTFIHSFSPDFSKGMLAIYEGYYFDNPKRMQEGMKTVGLIKSSDPKEIEEISRLLFSHFGDASAESVSFNLDHFKASFHNLFLHLKANQIRLPSDFLFLGIYLVTLYLALSKLGEELDVKTVFTHVWERNAQTNSP
jgi:predicted unusual protein kinase regulating ubiquinone biosynthesis (AarF/ABC1/UbiB family)